MKNNWEDIKYRLSEVILSDDLWANDGEKIKTLAEIIEDFQTGKDEFVDIATNIAFDFYMEHQDGSGFCGQTIKDAILEIMVPEEANKKTLECAIDDYLEHRSYYTLDYASGFALQFLCDNIRRCFFYVRNKMCEINETVDSECIELRLEEKKEKRKNEKKEEKSGVKKNKEKKEINKERKSSRPFIPFNNILEHSKSFINEYKGVEKEKILNNIIKKEIFPQSGKMNFLNKGENNSKVGFSNETCSDQKFPAFSQKEISGIISDIKNCINRSDKLFIHFLWQELSQLFSYTVSNEDGSQSEISENPEGMEIDATRLYPDALLPAFERTNETIASGYIQTTSENIKIHLQPLKPEEVDDIVKFELKRAKRVYIISSASFRNIKYKPSSEIHSWIDLSNKAKDMAYVQQIIHVGDDDQLYKTLSPLELAIYNFMCEYYDIDGDGNVIGPLKQFLTRSDISQLYIKLEDKGISHLEFMNTLNAKTNCDGTLQLRVRMFNADEIMRWNEINGFKSLKHSKA